METPLYKKIENKKKNNLIIIFNIILLIIFWTISLFITKNQNIKQFEWNIILNTNNTQTIVKNMLSTYNKQNKLYNYGYYLKNNQIIIKQQLNKKICNYLNKGFDCVKEYKIN